MALALASIRTTRRGSTLIGKQLRVYLHPDDQAQVDDFVRGELTSVLLAQRSPSPDPLELEGSGGSGMGPLICPASLLGSLRPRHIEARNEWILDVMTSPVIEWWLSKFDHGQIFPGRLYYVPEITSGHGTARKDKAFLEAADRLFKWMRESTDAVETDWGKERLGRIAATKFQNGEVSLRRNPPGSRI
jgi:hypothetical protein